MHEASISERVTPLSIKVDKGVRIPASVLARMKPRLPFRDLAIGDSFVFPTGRKLASCRASAAKESKRGRKFIAGQVGKIIRCWRVA